MKFLVTGQNRENGARMSLKFEAESKAAAERKALSSGMSVNRVEDITDGYVVKAHEPNPLAGRRKSGGNPLLPLLVLIAMAAVVYWLWPHIRHLIFR